VECLGVQTLSCQTKTDQKMADENKKTPAAKTNQQEMSRIKTA